MKKKKGIYLCFKCQEICLTSRVNDRSSFQLRCSLFWYMSLIFFFSHEIDIDNNKTIQQTKATKLRDKCAEIVEIHARSGTCVCILKSSCTSEDKLKKQNQEHEIKFMAHTHKTINEIQNDHSIQVLYIFETKLQIVEHLNAKCHKNVGNIVAHSRKLS